MSSNTRIKVVRTDNSVEDEGSILGQGPVTRKRFFEADLEDKISYLKERIGQKSIIRKHTANGLEYYFYGTIRKNAQGAIFVSPVNIDRLVDAESNVSVSDRMVLFSDYTYSDGNPKSEILCILKDRNDFDDKDLCICRLEILEEYTAQNDGRAPIMGVDGKPAVYLEEWMVQDIDLESGILFGDWTLKIMEALNRKSGLLRARVEEDTAKAEEMASKFAESQTKLANLEALYNEKMESMEADFEAKREQLQEEHEQYIEAMMAKSKSEAEEITRNHEKNIEEIMKQNAAKLELIRIEHENEIEKLNAIVRKYKLPIPGFSEKNKKEWEFSSNHDMLTEHVWSYLWHKEKLQYDRTVISRFLDSLHTGQMTVLWGDPGSGKTTLPVAAAKAIGARCIPISVQPNWTDNHDLLGYYNALEDVYIPTPFLEALLEAKRNEDTLYIIVLDEMNLAHIEYYFSEVLSAMTREDKLLTLYGETAENGIMSNISKLFNLDESLSRSVSEGKPVSEQDIEEVKECVAKIHYPARFEIPDNVRFVGTINVDQTTKTLSPKVIDRSYSIKVTSELLSDDEPEEASEMTYFVPAYSFVPRNSYDEELGEEIIEKIEKKIERIGEIKKIFEDICIVSRRFDAYAKQLIFWNPDLDLDMLVVDKILPELDISDRADNREAAGQVRDELMSQTLYSASEVLNKMLSDPDGFYWR